MLFKRYHRSCGLALACVVGVMGTPSLAVEGTCGRHSIEHLNAAFSAKPVTATVSNAAVQRVAATGVTATMFLYGDSEGIAMEMGVPGFPRMEFTLQSVGRGDAPWMDMFYGGDSGISAGDLIFGTGCDNERAIPRYTGTGSWISDDGTVVPTTIIFFLWIDDVHGAVNGIGHFESEWLTGTIRFNNY